MRCAHEDGITHFFNKIMKLKQIRDPTGMCKHKIENIHLRNIANKRDTLVEFWKCVSFR